MKITAGRLLFQKKCHYTGGILAVSYYVPYTYSIYNIQYTEENKLSTT